MNKKVSIILAIGILIAMIIIVFGNSSIFAKKEKNLEDIKIENGIQYVTISARGGYFPRISEAQGGIPTKLVVKTENTYDCSSALVIKSLNYRSILPQNGATEIDLGTPKSGDAFQGTCSMGMYSFTVKFK